jgi:hypothetical protein
MRCRSAGIGWGRFLSKREQGRARGFTIYRAAGNEIWVWFGGYSRVGSELGLSTLNALAESIPLSHTWLKWKWNIEDSVVPELR